MRKACNYFIKILAVFAIYTLSSFCPAYGQTLDVYIFYGENAVTDIEECQGKVIPMTVEVYGGSQTGITYTWTGDTDPTYFSDLGDLVSYKKTTPAGTYHLTVNITDDGGYTGSASITVVIKPSPLADIVAIGSNPLCDGGNVELKENNSQTGVTFQWQRNFSNISGAINESYNATISGNYRVYVSGSNSCSKFSNIITVTVNPLPVATAGSNSPICYDGTINLTSTPNAMVSYSWVTTAATPLTPANAALQNPSITNATPSNSGDYTVTVTDGNGCWKAATTTVVVYNDVSGGTIGLDHSICYNGDPNAFTDMASPSGGDASWSISWESFSGGGPWTPIIGADQLTYDAPAGLTQTTQYRRVATNGCETVNSNTITVTVYGIMNGGTIGSDQPLCSGGDPAAFTDITSPSGGNPPWTYSWESKVGAGAWTPIAGTNSLGYDVLAGITQTTDYRRVATNLCGTVYSNNFVTITITPTLSNNTIAPLLPICSGDTPGLLVGSTPSGGLGPGTYTYQWQSSTVGAGGPFNDIVGVVSRDYQPGSLLASTWYQRVAYSGACTSTSAPIAITVNPVITNNTIPALQNVCPGVQPANIVGSTPSGGDNLNYAFQWQLSSTGAGGPFNNVAGAINSDYRPSRLPAADRWYQRRVTSGGCTSMSNVIHISFYPDITNYLITDNQNICEGDIPLPLDGGASGGGTGPCTYRWQVASVAAAGPFSNIALATGEDYQPGALIANRWYRRITYSGTCNRISNVIAITVTPAIANNTISSSQPVCFNSVPSLLTGTIPTGGTGVYTFQWKSSTVGAGGPFTDIAGPTATLQDYQPGALTLNTWYVREVKSGLCSNTSSALAITVNPLPTITLTVIPPISACSSAEKFFLPYSATTGTRYSISAGAAPLAGFAAINNAPMVPSPLEIPIPKNSAAGTYQFIITVSDANGCVSTSQNFDLTINTIPVVNFGGVLDNQCADATTYLLTGGTPAGGLYSGPGVTTLTSNFDASVAGVGTHIITYSYSDGTCLNTNTNTITVNPTISGNTISASPTSICYNTNAALTGPVPSGGDGVTYTYKWQSSTAGAGGPFTDILDANATNKDYTSVAGIIQDTWYRRVVSSGPCIDNFSNVVMITVGPIFSVTITPQTPKCFGTPTGEATANPVGGTPGYTYSWSPISKTDNPVTGLSAGIPYTVTVTDNIGCTATATVTLTDAIELTLGLPVTTPVTGCFGGNNGSIQIQAAGGSGPYKYDLYNNGAFIATQTVAGSVTFSLPTTPIPASTQYEVRVTDANGCGSVPSGLIEVGQPDQLVITNVAQTDALCYGGATGTITITASGGDGSYTYSINGEFGTFLPTNSFTVLAGDYDIWVMDGKGCTATWGTINIGEPDQISVSASFEVITKCYDDKTGKITITPFPGVLADYDYTIYQFPTPAEWVPDNIFPNLAAGNYYAKVRNKVTGCIASVATNPIIITQPDPIVINLGTITPISPCSYSKNGKIQVLSSTGGTNPKQVSLDNINWHNMPWTFTGLDANNTVYVVDKKGCIANLPVTIPSPTPITLDAPPTVVGLSCNNVIPADGLINLSASGGAVGALSYSIDGGAPQANGNFTLLTAGSHTIRITDILGCFLDVTENVPEPPAIVFTTEQKTDITCFGVPADGTITLQASGGTGTLTYTINANPLNPMNGATLTPGAGLPAVFTGLMADSYSYKVTDSKGCDKSSTVNLDISEPPAITITNQSNIDFDCFTGTGTFSVDATGGTTPLVYNLYDNTHTLVTSNGDGEFTILQSGTYTVEVTDINSCASPPPAGPYTFTKPPQIVIDNQDFTQMTGAGADDGTITIQASGGTGALHYTLTTLNPLNPLAGTTLTPGAGLPALFTNLSADIYTVVVTDDNSCSISADPVRIGLLDLTLTPTQISCYGANDGQIVLTINSGTPGYTTIWDNNGVPLPAYDNLLTIGPLSPGLYTVNVVDAAGVPGGPVSVTIDEPDVLVATFISIINDKKCFGDANGDVSFNITGGTAPYTIAWTEGSTPRTEVVSFPPFIATNVAPGTYTFTITDAHLCPSVTIPNITLFDPPKFSITSIDSNNPLCNGGPGSITVISTGGTGVLTYILTGPPDYTSTDGIFTPLVGTYTVSLTDENGCTATSDVPNVVILTEPSAIVLSYSTPLDPLTCPDEPIGIANLGIVGGTQPYTYSWSNGQVTKDLINVVSGTYHVDVVDANGCTADLFVTILSKEPRMEIFATITPALCSELKVDNGFDTGKVKINSVSGGNGTIRTFLWNYPTNNPSTIDSIYNLSGGYYTVTVTDEEGCTLKSGFTVNSDPDYVMNAYILKDTILCGSSSVELVAFHNGLSTTPPAPYTYNWYKVGSNASGTPLGTQSTFTVYPTEKTQYYIEIKNDGGCLSRDTVTVDIYPKIDISVPLYISALQQNTDFKKDTIIAILFGNTYNLDVVTANTASPTTFNWEPKILFEPYDSWNSSIYIDKDIRAQIPANRIANLKETPNSRTTEFILVDVYATTEVGCKDSLRLYLKMVDNISFGNVFSPNDDGINDVWEVPKDYLFPDLNIEIFNRWGARVWSASGDKAAKGWNGRTDNGKELPIGTYYYVVKFNVNTSDGNWKPINGSITIVR